MPLSAMQKFSTESGCRLECGWLCPVAPAVLALSVTCANTQGEAVGMLWPAMLRQGCASLFSFVVPQLQTEIGGKGLFIAMGATVPLAIIALRWFPDRPLASSGVAAELPPMPPARITLLATVGLLIWYLVVGGYWPYVEQFARAANLDYAAAVRILGWATLISICGRRAPSSACHS